MRGPEPVAAGQDGSIDCLVVSTILVLLVAGGLIAWLSGVAVPGCGWAGVAPWGATFAVGALVGAAELLSRYRDNPRDAVASGPGVLYLSCNGLAAVLALYLLRTMGFDGFSDDTMSAASQVIIAGTGAMVLLRSKLFTLRQPSGTDVAFGPVFVVDTFLATINREVDRRRVPKRNIRVARWARRLSRFRFADAAPYLNAAMAAFQDLDKDDATRLRDEYNDLLTDERFKAYDDEVKFYLIGFDILTVFGETAFESLFGALEQYLLAHHKVRPDGPT